MIVHLPPDPRYRPVFLVVPAMLTILCPLLLALTGARFGDDARKLAKLGLCMGPALGLLAWQLLGRHRFRETIRPASHSASGDERRAARAAPVAGYSALNEGGAPFSSIVERAAEEGAAREPLRLPCLRRPEGIRLWWHPVMLCQHLGLGVMAWLLFGGGLSYLECLILPAIALWTVFTIVWLVLATPWNTIEIIDGEGWLNDAGDSRILRALERVRILRAIPAEDGMIVTLEREGEVQLRFAGGSLPFHAQRALLLEALGSGGETSTSPRTDAASTTRGPEAHP